MNNLYVNNLRYHTRIYALALCCIALLITFSGCEKKSHDLEQPGSGGPGNGGTDNGGSDNSGNTELFISFATPAWREKVDCSHLSFAPSSCPSDSLYYVTATSQSTNMTFHIAYPIDSVTFENLDINKRFPLLSPTCDYAAVLQKAISFLVVIPESKGSTKQWGPFPKESDKNYVVLKSITYVKSDTKYAHYRVAGSYSQVSVLLDADRNRISDAEEVITGDFQVMVLADRTSIAEQPERQPTRFRAQSETELSGNAGYPLEAPLEVRVQNERGMYLERVEVEWTISQGDGKLSAAKTLTDDNGYAAITWTLGEVEFQEVQARVKRYDGQTVDPVIFKATAAKNRIVLLSGDNQSGQSGFQLPKPLIVQVQDRHNQPLPGVDVHIRIVKGNGFWTTDNSGENRNEEAWGHTYYEEYFEGLGMVSGAFDFANWAMGTPGKPQELQLSLQTTDGEIINEYVCKATAHDSLGILAKKVPGKWVREWEGGQRDYLELFDVEPLASEIEGVAPVYYNVKIIDRYTIYSDGTKTIPAPDENGNPKIRHCWMEYTPADQKYWLKDGGSYFVHFWGWLTDKPFTYHPTESNYIMYKE